MVLHLFEALPKRCAGTAQHVAGGENNPERANNRPDNIQPVRNLQNQELADEIVERRQSDTG